MNTIQRITCNGRILFGKLEQLPLPSPAAVRVFRFTGGSVFLIFDDGEAHAAGEFVGFFQTDFHGHGELIDAVAALAHQGAALFVEMVVVLRQSAEGDDAVRAGFVEAGEQAETRHAADAARKNRAHFVREKQRGEAVGDFAFRRGGAALGGGDMFADFGKALDSIVIMPIKRDE